MAVASAAAHGHSENIECEGSGFFAPILGAEATGFFHDTNFHIDDLKCQKRKFCRLSCRPKLPPSGPTKKTGQMDASSIAFLRLLKVMNCSVRY